MVAIAPMTPDPSSPNMARRHKQVARLPSFMTSDSRVANPSPSLDVSVLCRSPKRENSPKQNPGTSDAERASRTRCPPGVRLAQAPAGLSRARRRTVHDSPVPSV